jgi:alpha-tubulin suppressor-like RCC1 family protein
MPRGLRLPGSGFVDVGCGGHHTFLVHESGAVFAVGLNNHGQLGVGDTEERDSPCVVEGVDREDGVAMVLGAEHHSVLLTGKGEIEQHIIHQYN